MRACLEYMQSAAGGVEMVLVNPLIGTKDSRDLDTGFLVKALHIVYFLWKKSVTIRVNL